MHSNRVSRLVCLVALLLVASLGFAQSLAGGAIQGTVSDATGAVVPGATLVAKNQATGLEYRTTSNEAGLFTFPVLPVGTYEVTADKQGFAQIKSIVSVTVGGKPNLPLVFKVAGQTQEVNVTSEAPLIETTRTQVSNTVDERAIKELPVNGRNFIDFALLTPGVTRDTRTGDISFAGQRGTLNSLTVDGADNNNTFFGQTVGRSGYKAPYQFSQDSVQEFQVASNAYSAELGRAGGAVINVVTKSGTNQFHGGAFEFFRDQSMNAYNPIQKLNSVVRNQPIAKKNKYHFNQFGGNIGGPIIKNKLFFFLDMDAQRNSQPNVLTPLPSLNSILNPPAPATPPAAADVPYITTAYNYLSARANNYTMTLNQNTYLAKLDYNFSAKHQFSARWNRQRFTAGNQENASATSSLEHTGDSVTHSDTATFSLTSTVTNSLVNQFRFTWLRDKEPGIANSALPEAQVRQGGQTLLIVGRNSFSPRETTIKRQQYADVITWVHGRSTIKFGGDLIVDKIYNYFPGNFSGVYVFSSLRDFGVSLGNCGTVGNPACTGTYNQAFAGTGTSGPVTNPDIVQASGFLQDDIRLRPNLTMNFGVRYDIQSVKQPSVRNPQAYAAGFDTSKIDINKNEWAPRFGFAYTPFSDGKTVIRGGYGMFYGNTPSLMIGTAHSNNGINVGTFTLTPQSYLAPIPTTNTANCNVTPKPSYCIPSIYVFQPDFKNPNVQQGNLGVEYALAKDLSFGVTYLWVKSTHLQRTADVNLGALSTATISDTVTGQNFTYDRYASTRPNADFQRISVFKSNANSNYNGMTVQLNKRFSHNFQGGISYTWSHVIDDAPDATAVVPFSSGDDAKIAMYSTAVGRERASGVNDQRHRFVLNHVWDLNYGKELPKYVKWITGGWQWSGILTAAAGQPYSNVVNGDLNGDSKNNDRLPGTGRNQYNLPATWSYDPRVTRNINLKGESVRLQLFAEAFNLFNRFNVTGVRNVQYALSSGTLRLQNQTTAPTAYWGLPTATSGGRIIQLGAKVTF